LFARFTYRPTTQSRQNRDIGCRKEFGNREKFNFTDIAARRARYDELVAEHYTRGRALSTAAAFEIDDVIDPAGTRTVLTAALSRSAPRG